MFNLSSNIILCGFMAAGKSSVGKFVADKLSLSFIDTDELIETKSNISIAEIFSTFGEAYFRDLEYNILKSLSDIEHSVIAIGGGLPAFERNVTLIKNMGTIIYIERDLQLIYDSIANDSSRPLAFKQSFQKLLEIYENRRQIYAACAYATVQNNSTISECADKIIAIYKNSKISH